MIYGDGGDSLVEYRVQQNGRMNRLCKKLRHHTKPVNIVVVTRVMNFFWTHYAETRGNRETDFFDPAFILWPV